MSKWLKTRLLRSVSTNKELQDAENMGTPLNHTYLDFPCVIDLSRVVEYNGTTLIDAGDYEGADATWVYLTPNNSTQILMPFSNFHELFMEFEKTK